MVGAEQAVVRVGHATAGRSGWGVQKALAKPPSQERQALRDLRASPAR